MLIDEEKISYKKVRDFGETFNVALRYLRQNFKSFFQSIIFIAGPFLLLSAIAAAYYQSDVLTMGRNNPFARLGTSYFLNLLAGAIANVVLVITVYSHMRVYAEKGPGNFTVGDVGGKLREHLGGLVSVFLLFGFLILITTGLIIVIFIGVADASPVLFVLLCFAGVVGAIILLPPFLWQMSVIYLVKLEDNDAPFDCYGRARRAMKDNFWWTWLLVVCAWLTVILAAIAFVMPEIIYRIVTNLINTRTGEAAHSSPLFLVLVALSTFGASLVYSVLHLICGFHFHSLEEKKDGAGLLERINEIGKTPANNVEQQY